MSSSNHSAKANENARGALDVRLNSLTQRRKIRGREAGDGLGVDIGIGTPTSGLESLIKGLKPENKAKLLEHVQRHVGAAMKPFEKLIEAKGTAYDLHMFRNVGPNTFRTIIELLEEEVNQEKQ